MAKEQMQRSKHAVCKVSYHFVWIPKRRKKVLVGNVAKRLKEVCQEVADANEWQLLELAVQPDHVHLFVEANPRIAPFRIVKAFKGKTSRILRQEFPHLLKLPSLWTHSYFVRTAGHVSAKTIERYIQEQFS